MNNEGNDGSSGGLFNAIGKVIQAFLLNYLLKKWGIINPITALDECVKREEWFKGVILSTTFFEAIGKRVLVDAMKGKIKPDKLEKMRLENVIILLFSIGKINKTTYSKMMEVRKFRNNLVHIDPFIVPKVQPKKAKKMIETANICIEELIEKWIETEEGIEHLVAKLEKEQKHKSLKEPVPLEEIEDFEQEE